MTEWAKIFRALSNENRLKIIQLLHRRRAMMVTGVAEQVKLSFKATSKHLIMLSQLGILHHDARDGKVYYSLSPTPRLDVKYILRKVFGAPKTL